MPSRELPKCFPHWAATVPGDCSCLMWWLPLPPPSSQTVRDPSASPSFCLSAQFGNMTHFCPVRRKGKSCWEVSGKSLLSLETALGRQPLLFLWAVTAGRASRKGPSRERPRRGRGRACRPHGFCPNLSAGGSSHLHVAKVPCTRGDTHVCPQSTRPLYTWVVFPAGFSQSSLEKQRCPLLSQEMYCFSSP